MKYSMIKALILFCVASMSTQVFSHENENTTSSENTGFVAEDTNTHAQKVTTSMPTQPTTSTTDEVEDMD